MDNYQIFPGVRLGADARIGPYVLVGVPPDDSEDGERITIIGEHAVVRSHTVIYAGNTIGVRFQTGHGVLIREDNVIGDDVSVGSNSVVEHHVRIGDGVRIHSNAFVPEFSVLEDGCWLGPNVVLTNAKYPRSPFVKSNLKGPTIRRGAKIGANSTLLPGIEIGEDALVGAGSVVTGNVAARTVVVGNPARLLKRLAELPYE